MSNNEDNIWDRLLLICKPEQSGKTFVMIQKIIKDLREPINGVKIINIIFCDNNLLTNLDVSQNTKLERLDCFSNQLTFLDLSNNILLKNLSCNNNQLISLDLSNNTELTFCVQLL